MLTNLIFLKTRNKSNYEVKAEGNNTFLLNFHTTNYPKTHQTSKREKYRRKHYSENKLIGLLLILAVTSSMSLYINPLNQQEESTYQRQNLTKFKGIWLTSSEHTTIKEDIREDYLTKPKTMNLHL